MLSAEKITLEELLDAGVHFGHQRRRWHPRMAPYIYTEEKGVHIFDLAQTRECLIDAAKFLHQTAKDGGTIIFVGTKRQAKEIVRREAERCGAMHITERWLGGLLTNFGHVKINMERLNDLTEKREKGELAHYTKKEQLLIDRQIRKLELLVGGIRDLKDIPDAIVLASARREQTAVREANRKGVPLVAIVDTNTDPRPVGYPIPGNDDARKSLALIFRVLGDAVEEGYKGSKGSKGDKRPKGHEEANAGDGGVEGLGLSIRSLNALKKAGIETVEQLRKMSEEELKAVRGLGEKSVEEILKSIKSQAPSSK
jgi:small subunit ribosomal protein S2